jgi:hypothetical protein
MQIKVIGAGIYGCHLTLSLKELGYRVELFESKNKIFQGASGNNQFRLHHGFHYPRNAVTRRQSKEGFKLFKDQYGDFCLPISDNLYSVVKDRSITDFETYKSVMASDSLEFEEYELKLLNTSLIEGTLNTKEEVLDLEGLARFFETQLDGVINLGHQFELSEKSNKQDLIIDCTWDASNQKNESYFEPTVLLYYELLNPDLESWSQTLVDGNFWSLYRTSKKNRFTLSHVTYSALENFQEIGKARCRLNSLTTKEVDYLRKCMESEVLEFFPSFFDHFKFEEPQLSIKTKKSSASANRACEVEKTENVISVRSGKLDTIFFAETEVLKILGELNH